MKNQTQALTGNTNRSVTQWCNPAIAPPQSIRASENGDQFFADYWEKGRSWRVQRVLD